MQFLYRAILVPCLKKKFSFTGWCSKVSGINFFHIFYQIKTRFFHGILTQKVILCQFDWYYYMHYTSNISISSLLSFQVKSTRLNLEDVCVEDSDIQALVICQSKICIPNSIFYVVFVLKIQTWEEKRRELMTIKRARFV